jgi:hypothetical protein
MHSINATKVNRNPARRGTCSFLRPPSLSSSSGFPRGARASAHLQVFKMNAVSIYEGDHSAPWPFTVVAGQRETAGPSPCRISC